MSTDPPSLITEINSTADALNETIDALEDYTADIDEYHSRVEGMSADEREMFYQSVDDIREKVADATEPDEILATADEVESAVRSPLRQLAAELLDDFVTSVDPSLEADARSQVVNSIKAKPPVELEQITSAYRSVVRRVADFEAVQLSVLASAIETDPALLEKPTSELEPRIDRIEGRGETLAAVSTLFETKSWTPTLELMHDERFYGPTADAIEATAIESDLDAIDEGLVQLAATDIQITDVVAADIAEAADSGDAAELARRVSEIEATVTEAATTCVEVVEFMSTLDGFDTDECIYAAEIDALRQKVEELRTHEYSSLGYAEQTVADTNDAIESLVDTVTSRLNAQQDLVAELDVPADVAAPTTTLQERQAPLQSASVRTNPVAALEDCATLRSWITAQLDRELDAGEHDQLLELWQRLTNGDPVKLTAKNRETILALADRLPLHVSM